jgi:hypothetical protein
MKFIGGAAIVRIQQRLKRLLLSFDITIYNNKDIVFINTNLCRSYLYILCKNNYQFQILLISIII